MKLYFRKVGTVAVILIALALVLTLLTGCTIEKTEWQKTIDDNNESITSIRQQYEVPVLTRSQDYENIIRRAEYLNTANNVGYLYLLSTAGIVLEEVQVLGKVTSLNSYITPMEELQWRTQTSSAYGVVSAADIDGTYGENVTGIFWFTPDGAYGEWNGEYRFSSERLTFQSEAILIK